MIGARMDPSDDPLYASATPRACLSPGSESRAVRKPPGKIDPSPIPSTARAAANPRNELTAAWEALDTIQMNSEIAIPARRPIRSRTDPHASAANMYVKLNALMHQLYSCAVMCV